MFVTQAKKFPRITEPQFRQMLPRKQDAQVQQWGPILLLVQVSQLLATSADLQALRASCSDVSSGSTSSPEDESIRLADFREQRVRVLRL